MKKMTNQKAQSRLEVVLSLVFSAVIVLLSTTKIGYIEVEGYRNVDLSLIPALFAAMIGGYKMVIPISLIWTFSSYSNVESDMWILGFYWTLATKGITIFFTTFFYQLCKKIFPQAPENVYRTIVLTLIIKSIFFNTLFFIIYMNADFDSLTKQFLLNSLYIMIIELALSCLAMKMLINHLRQIHILNGVKRKEKKQKKGVDK